MLWYHNVFEITVWYGTTDEKSKIESQITKKMSAKMSQALGAAKNNEKQAK